VSCCNSDLSVGQDPVDSGTDTEQQSGNILNAMLSFPSDFTFHVVGRTLGNVALEEQFVRQVKDVVQVATSQDELKCTVLPRGTKYTKVSIEVNVANSDAISLIYERLGRLELAVMRF
jgi:putative lipoic acid-binding regulatory protein